MKKLIVMMMLAALMVGCQNGTSKGNEKAETVFVKETKQRLSNLLENNIKKGTKAEGMDVVYANEEDSICVINCTCVITKASGRTISGRLQYVFYNHGVGGQKDLFINLEEEQSIIVDAMDFIDKVEDDVEPERRDSIGGWEESMKFVVPLRFIKQSTERFKEEYGY